MIITAIDVQAAVDVFIAVFAISSLLGFIAGGFIYVLCRSVIRKINSPMIIKTDVGLLYRSSSGSYVKKELLHKVNNDFKLKNRERWIRHHQRQIDYLRNS